MIATATLAHGFIANVLTVIMLMSTYSRSSGGRVVEYNPEIQLQVAPSPAVHARGACAIQRHVPTATQD